MPVFGQQIKAFKAQPDIQVNWESFKGGWNNIFKPTELEGDELAEATNSMLVGEGTPTGRWGSQKFHLAGGAGRVRLLEPYVVSGRAASQASTNLLLSITDDGFLTKRSGASYEMITGASFASGHQYQGVQLGNNTYIASASLPFVRFDGANLIPYLQVGAPTNVSIANMSSASGTTTYSWLVTAITAAGETGAFENGVAVAKSLATLPLDLSLTAMKITWGKVSAATGVIKGYNVYRGFPGDETFIGSTGEDDTEFIDTGAVPSQTQVAPDNNLTGGLRAKYILKFDDRIVLAGIQDDPSRVYISGRWPDNDRFDALGGGASLPVSPDDGDEITGLGIAGNQGMSSGGSAPPASAILVFKKNSTHRVVLGTAQIGNFVILDPQAQLLATNGCSSADTVQAVENDTFYFGTKGLYTVGQEPNFLNQIRTNELSARIRPYIQNLAPADFDNAVAGYIDNKYLLSFPDKKETIIYDRERAAFMGPWKTPYGITKWLKYFDTDGTEKYLAGGDDSFTHEFSSSYLNDDGTAFTKKIRTRKEDMKEWNTMKVIKQFYALFRNVRGTVTIDIRIEDRNGNTVTQKSFDISSSLGEGGWGGDQWGTQQWGESEATVSLTGDELVRWTQLFKQARVLQVEVTADGANDNFEFLGVRFTAQSLGASSLPSSTRV